MTNSNRNIHIHKTHPIDSFSNVQCECMWDGEWSNSSVYCSHISGLEVFIINSGVDVSLVAEELNRSSEEQEYNTHTNSMR